MFRAHSRKRLSGEFISPMLGAESHKSSNEHLANVTLPGAKLEDDSVKRAKLNTQVSLPSTSKSTKHQQASTTSDTKSFPLRIGPQKSREELEKRITDLEAESNRLNDQIGLFTQRGFNTEELDKHIKVLHEYNELKDVGSTLLGRLAFAKGISMNEVYKEYKLNLQD